MGLGLICSLVATITLGCSDTLSLMIPTHDPFDQRQDGMPNPTLVHWTETLRNVPPVFYCNLLYKLLAKHAVCA
jgi:hypothetical protein